MNFLKIELVKNLPVILFALLFSCDKGKQVPKKGDDNISVNVIAIKKKNDFFNILISINNNSNNKYVMLYNYHSFGKKEDYPKVIFNQNKTYIDYNFFFNTPSNDTYILNDPPMADTNESFTLLILPSGKRNVWLKNISKSDLKEKNYLWLYFSKMKSETIKALPQDTQEYDIIANKKGFKNYEFVKKEIFFKQKQE